MRPLELDPETDRILAFIASNTFPLSVYGRKSKGVASMVRDLVTGHINRFGVPLAQRNQYRSFTSEMLKAFRTKTKEPSCP